MKSALDTEAVQYRGEPVLDKVTAPRAVNKFWIRAMCYFDDLHEAQKMTLAMVASASMFRPDKTKAAVPHNAR